MGTHKRLQLLMMLSAVSSPMQLEGDEGGISLTEDGNDTLHYFEFKEGM